MTSSRILIELVIVLGTAAVVTVAFQALRLPVVLGYVLAGLVIGPNIPIPLVADASLVHVLSELGVILLMFTVGLELPLRSIARVGVAGALTALFEVGLVIAVGTLVATLCGLDATTAVFAGCCLGISSTMLVAKAFDELGWKGGFTELVFAVLVFEDLIAIVLLAVITAVASGAGLDAAALGLLLGKLAGFLALMLVGGLLVVPRLFRWIAKRARRETLLITALLVCFGNAALAEHAGFSVALGAFIAGVLVAESGHGHDVFELVGSFRDVFAAVFFVSVGMTIEPAMLADQAPRIVALALVVLLVKPLGVATSVFLAGNGVRPALRAGLSLAQIGEFSFVIAGVIGSPELLAIAVGVSVITTLTSPLFIRKSEASSAWLAGRLPRRLATFVSFYEGWLGRRRASAWRRHRRDFIVLALDTAVVIAVVITGAVLGHREGAGVMRSAIVVGIVAVVCLPFLVAMLRRIAVLSRQLASELVPGEPARRALVVTFELALASAIVVPAIAIVQPFVPGSFVALLVLALVLVVAMGKRIRELDTQVRASSELLLDLLAKPAEQPVTTILPGFGECATVTVQGAAGRSLAELDVRAKTGATVLAIVRGEQRMITPAPSEPLQAGDVLALAGSDAAIAEARSLLASS